MAGTQEKTEKPTPKRLSDARRKGQVPKSKEITALVVLFGAMLFSVLAGPLIFKHFQTMVEAFWDNGFGKANGFLIDKGILFSCSYHFLVMAGPLLVFSLALGVLANLVQLKGFLMAGEILRPDLARLNPLKGVAHLISLRSLMELAKALIKVAVVSWAIYWTLEGHLDAIISLVDQAPTQILRTMGTLAFKLTTYVSLAMLPAATLDFYYQRWQHLRDLRMTKQEVKEEIKQREGDPQVRSRIRSIQRALARQRMLSDVAKAKVVVTNPTRYAVALQYSSGMEAPRVVAKGMNLMAKKIIKIAQRYGVPVISDPPLARALYKLEVGDTIPVSLYRAVAKLLAYIYRQKGKVP